MYFPQNTIQNLVNHTKQHTHPCGNMQNGAGTAKDPQGPHMPPNPADPPPPTRTPST